MLWPSSQDGWDALAAAVVGRHAVAGTDWKEHRRNVQLGLYEVPATAPQRVGHDTASSPLELPLPIGKTLP